MMRFKLNVLSLALLAMFVLIVAGCGKGGGY